MNPWLMAGGALLGLRSAEKQNEQARRNARYNADLRRYAAWTKMTEPGHRKNTSEADYLTSMIGGATAGELLGQKLGGVSGAGGMVDPSGARTLTGAPTLGANTTLPDADFSGLTANQPLPGIEPGAGLAPSAPLPSTQFEGGLDYTPQFYTPYRTQNTWQLMGR